eukprot:403334201
MNNNPIDNDSEVLLSPKQQMVQDQDEVDSDNQYIKSKFDSLPQNENRTLESSENAPNNIKVIKNSKLIKQVTTKMDFKGKRKSDSDFDQIIDQALNKQLTLINERASSADTEKKRMIPTAHQSNFNIDDSEPDRELKFIKRKKNRNQELKVENSYLYRLEQERGMMQVSLSNQQSIGIEQDETPVSQKDINENKGIKNSELNNDKAFLHQQLQIESSHKNDSQQLLLNNAVTQQQLAVKPKSNNGQKDNRSNSMKAVSFQLDFYQKKQKAKIGPVMHNNMQQDDGLQSLIDDDFDLFKQDGQNNQKMENFKSKLNKIAVRYMGGGSADTQDEKQIQIFNQLQQQASNGISPSFHIDVNFKQNKSKQKQESNNLTLNLNDKSPKKQLKSALKNPLKIMKLSKQAQTERINQDDQNKLINQSSNISETIINTKVNPQTTRAPKRLEWYNKELLKEIDLPTPLPYFESKPKKFKRVYFRDERPNLALCEIYIVQSYKKIYADDKKVQCACSCQIF